VTRFNRSPRRDAAVAAEQGQHLVVRRRLEEVEVLRVEAAAERTVLGEVDLAHLAKHGLREVRYEVGADVGGRVHRHIPMT
jgi:hypothetical protein